MNPSDRPANRLSHESSPYLLQHAYNPVDWYPWGDEALEKSKALDRPILLSVGYSACHWCHVMEHESFENSSIAEQMNRHFICIKVDREERPDIDAIYMSAVQLMTGQGGWPMTVFLTPEGKPFYGGTYFPPDDRYGRPGFPRVLEAVSAAWKSQRIEIEQQSDEITQTISQDSFSTGSGTSLRITSSLLATALDAMSAKFDRTNGGFGAAPKFPQPASLDLLLRLHQTLKRDAAQEMVEKTLQRMALGGIYDQLGGGFHRYSTDAVWLAPHFEKMLYDNAQLALTYCRAYQLTGKQFYRDISEETLEYILREMTDPATGAFYSAQDADSEGEEGRFFVWSRAELDQILGERDAAIFGAFFDVTDGGNWEGKNILHVIADAPSVAARFGIPVSEAAQILDSARVQLLEVRGERIAPGLDDKILTSWNGLALSAFAKCGAAFDRTDFIEAAIRNAEFLTSVMAEERVGMTRLFRTCRNGAARLNGYLEDYSFLAEALLDLYETTLDQRWLDKVIRLVDSMNMWFKDPRDGSFYTTSTDHEALIHRMKDWDDNAIPCGNSVAFSVLLRLSALRGDVSVPTAIAKTLRPLAEAISQQPYGFGRMLGVLDRCASGSVEIALRGEASHPVMRQMLSAIHRIYCKDLVVAAGEVDERDDDLPLLKSRPAVNGLPTAYVCVNQTCSLPISSAEELERTLRELVGRR